MNGNYRQVKPTPLWEDIDALERTSQSTLHQRQRQQRPRWLLHANIRYERLFIADRDVSVCFWGPWTSMFRLAVGNTALDCWYNGGWNAREHLSSHTASLN